MPLPLNVIEGVKTVVTHEGCADGVVSALVLKHTLCDLLGLKVEFVFCQHKTEKALTLPATEGMLFCDFVPPADRVGEFVKAGTIVLDHHKGAKAIVEAFGPLGVFADERAEPGVSGAVLAYREVLLPIAQQAEDHRMFPSATRDPYRVSHHMQSVRTADEVSRLIGIRDTWQNKDPDWVRACSLAEAIRSIPAEEWLEISALSSGSGVDWEEEIRFGGRLYWSHQRSAERAVKEAYWETIKGKSVAMLFGTNISDASEILAESADLVIGFHYRREDDRLKVTVALRSKVLNCFEIAQALGGDGHTGAAGFSVEVFPGDPNPYRYFTNLLNRVLPG
jgi:hypothetical protein